MLTFFEKKRCVGAVLLVVILGFAMLHCMHPSADFPHQTAWMDDDAKYTDEGWWAIAATRAHLTGNWQLAGDYNPAPATPLLPLLEWITFSITGVSLIAARGLVTCIFLLDVYLGYRVVRAAGSEIGAYMCAGVLLTSSYFYCFSRIALLEPLVILLLLVALETALHLSKSRYYLKTAGFLGFLCALLMLAKPTAVFGFPALLFTALWPMRQSKKQLVQVFSVGIASYIIPISVWIVLLVQSGNWNLYSYLLSINVYPKEAHFWIAFSVAKSLYHFVQVDPLLITAGMIFPLFLLILWQRTGRTIETHGRFTVCFLLSVGFYLFVVYQDLAQARSFAVAAFFLVLMLGIGAGALVKSTGAEARMGKIFLGILAVCLAWNGFRTLHYGLHPEYSFSRAVAELTRYVDEHPNGNRILVSSSSDSIYAMSHLPGLCDAWGTEPLAGRIARYQPGWFAVWNSITPEEVEAIHTTSWMEEVGAWEAFDRPTRNRLVLIKLHPLSEAARLSHQKNSPREFYPEDKMLIPLEDRKMAQQNKAQKIRLLHTIFHHGQ